MDIIEKQTSTLESTQAEVNLNTLNEFNHNLNESVKDEVEETVEEGDEEEYEDLEVVDLKVPSNSEESEMDLKYRVIVDRYDRFVPDMNKILKSKEPSPRMRYLILSNLMAIAYLYRLHNGDVLDENSSQDLASKLLTQVLSTEA